MITKGSVKLASPLLALALAAGMVVALPAFDEAARAEKVTVGNLQSFDDFQKENTGLLFLDTNAGEKKFRVTQKTACAFNTGQSGGPFPCKNLDKDKYADERTQVKWILRDGRRRATEVLVYNAPN